MTLVMTVIKKIKLSYFYWSNRSEIATTHTIMIMIIITGVVDINAMINRLSFLF